MCTNCKECKGGAWCGCSISIIMKVLVIVGGINWGLVGAGMLSGSSINMNLVNVLFGNIPSLEAVIYLLVGIAAISSIWGCKCKKCKNNTCCSTCSADKKY